MNRFVKKLLLVVFLASSLSLSGQTFGEADLERLIMNHPMLKNYDFKTGYFKNTPYELKDVDELKAENASLTQELEKIVVDQKKNATRAFEESDLDEEVLWSKASSLEEQKNKILSKIDTNDDLINNKGLPGRDKLYPIIDKICNDIFIPLYNKNRIILNKLPRYPFYDVPELGGNDLHSFWYNHEEKVLIAYLKQAYIIGFLFPSSDKTILYQKPSGD